MGQRHHQPPPETFLTPHARRPGRRCRGAYRVALPLALTRPESAHARLCPYRQPPARSPSAPRPMSGRRGRGCGGPERKRTPRCVGCRSAHRAACGARSDIPPTSMRRRWFCVVLPSVAHGPLGRAGPACPGATPPAAGAPAYLEAAAPPGRMAATGTVVLRRVEHPWGPCGAEAGVTVTVRSGMLWSQLKVWCGAARGVARYRRGCPGEEPKESEAGSPHIVRGRPACALVYRTRAAVTSESIARRSCPPAVSA